jgi:hypothetical protein
VPLGEDETKDLTPYFSRIRLKLLLAGFVTVVLLTLFGPEAPVIQERPGGPQIDPSGAVIPLICQLSMEDFGASAVRVSSDGTLSAR